MKNRLLIIGGFVAAIVAIRLLILLPGWMKERRENRQFIAVNNLTPDRLMARCGQPLTDDTRNIYPILARDMRYQGKATTITFKFSRTAEESSDWVFMEMQDGTGNANYDTPEAKIAVLPCLDSRK